MNSKTERVMTVKEVADNLKMSVTWVYEQLRSLEKDEYYKSSNIYLITQEGQKKLRERKNNKR